MCLIIVSNFGTNDSFPVPDSFNHLTVRRSTVSATDIIVKQTERRKSIFKYNTKRIYRIKNRLIYTME